MADTIDRFARAVSSLTGSAPALVLATAACALWVAFDRAFDALDAVSALTFWMLFVLQSSQNRDTAETLAELRELVRAVPQADEGVIPDD